VIVVGEITNLPRLKGSQIQILKFADIERDGVTAGAVNTPHPGQFLHSIPDLALIPI
jgi:hypothetical protein